MRVHKSCLAAVAAGALAGIVLTALATASFVEEGRGGIVDSVIARPFWVAAGAIAGALCGFAAWALFAPRQRISRSAMVLVTVNCASWLLFLGVNARVPDGGASVEKQRASIDRLMNPDHPPTLLAGRELNWVRLSQKPLGFMAGPAVVFVHEQIVPARYWRTGATVSESNWIALAGFILSTAWWVTAGSLRSARR